jgi:hypothetical protein
MNVSSDKFDSARRAKPPVMLDSLDWRVWFLGYGVGGCFGLCLCAGIWSLLVDVDKSLGAFTLAISMAHASLLVTFWLRRSTTLARRATRICYLAGALGITLAPLILTSGESRVPALGSLYSLALMNAIIGFTVPLTFSQKAAEPRHEHRVAEPVRLTK